jgi:hypothetical protein
VEIEETDLLFIDTCDIYGQLQQELRLHAAKVRKYLVLTGYDHVRGEGRVGRPCRLVAGRGRVRAQGSVPDQGAL